MTTKEEKQRAFLKIARKNMANFELHQRCLKEAGMPVGLIQDEYLLQLIDYAEKYAKLTEFAQLQKPVSEEHHYNTKVVKGKDLKLNDVIWYAQEFKEIVITEFRDMLRKTYPNDLFLVQISHKEQ